MAPVPTDELSFCVSCLQAYPSGTEICILPCAHTIHNNTLCKSRLLHGKCYWPKCRKASATAGSSSSADAKNSPPREFPLGLFTSSANQDVCEPVPFTTVALDGNPSIKNVSGRHNPSLQAAKNSGSAVNTSNDVEQLPNFAAPRAGVSLSAPRGQIAGPVRNRTALIHPVAEDFVEITRKGFEAHPPMILDYDDIPTAQKRPDLARFAITPSIHQHSAWDSLVAHANWWGIPPKAGTDRSFARDIYDCQWISRTSADITAGSTLSASYFASQELVHRLFHSFNHRMLYMKEAVWRREKGLWISFHDPMWSYLPSSVLKANFPQITQTVHDLALPVGLGIPTPPTPFYYGTQMSRLQSSAPLDPLLQQFEDCTLKEIIILTMARFYCEMVYGGRLFRLKTDTIALMRTTVIDMDINLPIANAELFRIMDSVNDYPSRLFCTVDFVLPSWTLLGVPETQFLWSLKPGAAINNNAAHGRRIEQYLDGTKKTDKIGTSRPLTPTHTPYMRTVLKQVEIDENPRLAKFVEDEFKGTIPLLSIGELLERLSYRAVEKLRERGEMAPAKNWV